MLSREEKDIVNSVFVELSKRLDRMIEMGDGRLKGDEVTAMVEEMYDEVIGNRKWR